MRYDDRSLSAWMGLARHLTKCRQVTKSLDTCHGEDEYRFGDDAGGV
jgi:hypothetical protein